MSTLRVPFFCSAPLAGWLAGVALRAVQAADVLLLWCDTLHAACCLHVRCRAKCGSGAGFR